MRKVAFLLVAFVTTQLSGQHAATTPAATADSPEINTLLMETTFLITEPSAKPGEERLSRCGTSFVVLRLAKPDTEIGQYVLVTAKHVFEDIRGDTATLVLRKRTPTGDIDPLFFPLKIRDNGKPLYTEHPTEDVAAIDVVLPKESITFEMGANIANPNWFASDAFLRDIEIHPGDELLTLSYPICVPANTSGYAMLRIGKIASYPIVPIKKAGRIFFDF